MSGSSQTTRDQGVSPVDELEKINELVATVQQDAPKAVNEKNKQAGRRARKALNDLKKICTPLRQKIQDAIKGSSDGAAA